MRAPGGWALGINGIPVPDAPTPTSRSWRDAVHRHYWGALTTEQRNGPQWRPVAANFGRYDGEVRHLHDDEMNDCWILIARKLLDECWQSWVVPQAKAEM